MYYYFYNYNFNELTICQGYALYIYIYIYIYIHIYIHNGLNHIKYDVYSASYFLSQWAFPILTFTYFLILCIIYIYDTISFKNTK